ncbi:MAG TPA: carbohydrate binding family 9 domain-containing protein [archaeon]|nr:carbohydrate binding family 9 domain-containing protein [archaeon]
MARANSIAMVIVMLFVIIFGYTGKAECSAVSKSDSLSSLSKEGNQSMADSVLKTGSEINIYVKETDQPIKIDGKLDDAAWQSAVPYHEYFYQQEPLDRAPSSQKTEIRVLQDENNIYFGAQCYDSPDKVFASVKRRDGSFLNDDAFELLIDTFQDKRNSYAFGTNPFGVEVDAIISDEGNHINKSWDCIWYCKTAINDKGWAIEMSIPFKSLKYKKGELVDWGLNITREIKHSKEVTYLVPVPRGLGHNGKFKGSLFANLKNIRPPSSSLNVEIQPYVTSGRTYIYEPHNFNSKLDAGFDVRYHVTPQLAMDLTYQTDFAQAESEQEVVNVDRFNINLPEKRDFFLESAGIFKFGSGISSGGTVVGASEQSEFMLFNSRTIGIKNDQRIPLLGGVKMAGRTGKYSLGVINFQSKSAELDDGTVEPSTNFTAVKIKRDLFTNSNIGLMILNKQSSDQNYSRAVGSDAFFAFSPEFIVNGSVAGSFTPGNDSKNWAGDIGAILNKDWVDLSVRYTQVDTLFNPEMGFVSRGNVRSTKGTLSFTKWINNDYLKSMSLINDLEYKTDHHNTLVYRENRVNFWLTFKSQDFFSYGLHRRYDYLPGNDYIRDIMIEQGGYLGYHQHLEFTSYRARRFSGSIHYRWGDSYDGRSRSLTVSNNMKITNNFNMDLEYSYDYLDYNNGSLKANVLAGRWTYSFSTELFAKCYVQWNDADHKIATNFLIDYIYKPKSHIYLVFNENRDTALYALSKVKDRMLLLKFTYLWSL